MVHRADILLVDDEPDLRQSVMQTLERAGYSVRSAVDGVDAMQALESFTPRLLICDLVMPKLDGVELIRGVRARGEVLKIIAVSGGMRRDGGPVLAEALDAGADAVLAKPFGVRDLLKLVADVLNDETQASTKV